MDMFSIQFFFINQYITTYATSRLVSLVATTSHFVPYSTVPVKIVWTASVYPTVSARYGTDIYKMPESMREDYDRYGGYVGPRAGT